jgi:tRNA pseudouridine38-40 synthase
VTGDAAGDVPPGEPEAPHRTLRLDLEYEGTAFHGWQRQDDERTVQAAVEQALSRVFGHAVAVAGAGRTDAGAHAAAMTASCVTSSTLAPEVVARALEAHLPEDVGVLSVRDAPTGFHARRDARWKWYRYAVLRSRERRVAWRRTAWRVGARLDLAAMEAATRLLVGRHDFASFQSAGSPRRSTVRTLAGLAWSEEGPLLHLDAVADGFLYGMVRALVGTLVEVGRGRRDAASVAGLLASRDRTRAGPAAPAHGLTLVRVGYGGDPPPGFVDPALSAGLGSTGRTGRTPPPEPDGCGS